MDRRHLLQLTAAWCDGCIDEDDLRLLQQMLAESADARKEYFAYMDVHSGVHGYVAARESLDALLTVNAFEDAFDGECRSAINSTSDRHAMPRGRSAWGLLVTALAATLAFALLAWQLGSPGVSQLRSLVSQSDVSSKTATPITQSTDSSPMLAEAVPASADCRWFVESSGKWSPQGVHAGDAVRLATGTMRLKYRNGTVVTLHSPGLFEIVSDMQTRVMIGKLTANIAKGGEGYTVVTPRATVIDLGTEFGVEVSSIGATDVVVFKGAVDVDYRPDDDSAARQQRLNLGEALRLDAFGTPSRLVSISSQRFAEDTRVHEGVVPRSPLISAVHDNIQREDSLNYYEIVPQGMQEDVLAFVDREAHQWNGVEASGMPAYLLGGDYVKTFNNDRTAHDIEIVVTLEQPSRLYVLFDDRIPVPAWLKNEFRNTGDKIGVDVGPFYSKGAWHRKHQPAVGPGVEIDDVMSIWVRDIRSPGPVRLGATESSETGLNMYGIVAVPWASADGSL